VEDVVKESLRIDRGHIYPPRGPGLGIELDMDKVKALARRISG
jgi:L-alanine-DL-glutamate epimerase-like enolase superfamily enzyme